LGKKRKLRCKNYAISLDILLSTQSRTTPRHEALPERDSWLAGSSHGIVIPLSGQTLAATTATVWQFTGSLREMSRNRLM